MIAAFVREIGLPVAFAAIDGKTVLPGIRIVGGTLVVDGAQLVAAGDLLHEAGHLAVMTPLERGAADGAISSSPAEEMMAIAWSYAAGLHLDLAPSVVFHEHGYRGGARALVENFTNGRYVGVPMLQWIGMADDPHTGGGEAPYPHMRRWLRA